METEWVRVILRCSRSGGSRFCKAPGDNPTIAAALQIKFLVDLTRNSKQVQRMEYGNKPFNSGGSELLWMRVHPNADPDIIR